MLFDYFLVNEIVLNGGADVPANPTPTSFNATTLFSSGHHTQKGLSIGIGGITNVTSSSNLLYNVTMHSASPSAFTTASALLFKIGKVDFLTSTFMSAIPLILLEGNIKLDNCPKPKLAVQLEPCKEYNILD